MSDPLVQRVTILATDIERRVRRLETLEGSGSAAPGTTSWPGFNDAGGNPADVGTVAADGVVDYPARRDHVHAITGGTILARLLTVDGTGSGLDADLLDGQHAAAFAGTADVTAGTILAKLITVDGTGSGLDADTLDGQHAAAFATAGHTHIAGTGDFLQLIGGAMSGSIDMNSNALLGLTGMYGQPSPAAGITFFTSAGSVGLFIEEATRRVGIRTFATDNDFNVAGNSTLSGALYVTSNIDADGNIVSGGSVVGGKVIAPEINATTAAGLRIEDDGGNLGLFVEDGGQVGVGTASPSEALEVLGNVKASGIVKVPELNATSAAGLRIEDDGNNLGVFIEDGGYVGIGTADPASALHVLGTATVTGVIAATGTDSIAKFRPGQFNLTSDQVLAIPYVMAMCIIHNGSDGTTAIMFLRGGVNAVNEVSDPTNTFSVTKDTASSINVYYDAGAGSYVIQNKRGATKSIHMFMFGAATSF